MRRLRRWFRSWQSILLLVVVLILISTFWPGLIAQRLTALADEFKPMVGTIFYLVLIWAGIRWILGGGRKK